MFYFVFDYCCIVTLHNIVSGHSVLLLLKMSMRVWVLMVCQSFRCCTLAHSRAALRITVVGILNTLNTGSSLEEILTRCQPDQQSHYLVCQNDQESKVCKYPYLRQTFYFNDVLHNWNRECFSPMQEAWQLDYCCSFRSVASPSLCWWQGLRRTF